MFAILVLKGTNNCDDDNNAISVSKETYYACNLKFESDHIFLQSFSVGSKYA